jgi:hypothetical protein
VACFELGSLQTEIDLALLEQVKGHTIRPEGRPPKRSDPGGGA